MEIMKCDRQAVGKIGMIIFIFSFFTWLLLVSGEDVAIQNNILKHTNIHSKIIQTSYNKGFFYMELDEYQSYILFIPVANSRQKEFEQFIEIGDVLIKKKENDSIWIQKSSGETKVFVYDSEF